MKAWSLHPVSVCDVVEALGSGQWGLGEGS